jgi:hypothetical protein
MKEKQMSEQEARELGWVPQEEFRGDVEKWVDADTFVERGNTVMPLLRKHKQELQTQVQVLQASLRESTAAIKALQDSRDADTAKAVKEARQSLLLNLEQAHTDGDTKAVVKLTEALVDLKEAEKPVAKPTEPQAETMAPEFIEFAEANPWYGKDIRKTNRANGIANLIRSDEANDHLTGRQFFAKLLEEMEGKGQPSKVAGGKPSGSSGSGGGGKSYHDLPADAKAACEKQGRNRVGDGKPFKTAADWQKRYAELYFQGE